MVYWFPVVPFVTLHGYKVIFPDVDSSLAPYHYLENIRDLNPSSDSELVLPGFCQYRYSVGTGYHPLHRALFPSSVSVEFTQIIRGWLMRSPSRPSLRI